MNLVVPKSAHVFCFPLFTRTCGSKLGGFCQRSGHLTSLRTAQHLHHSPERRLEDDGKTEAAEMRCLQSFSLVKFGQILVISILVVFLLQRSILVFEWIFTIFREQRPKG